MSKEPKAMQEIHKIRENHFMRTKDMSVEQRVKETREKAKRIIKERNLKLKNGRD